MSQDSIKFYQDHAESVSVTADNITSQDITSLLNTEESIGALWNLVHLEYIFFVCVTYYIIVTRVRALKTNTVGRRNALLFGLTVIWGAVGHLWRETPLLNLLVTGLCVNAFYEFIFKSIFKALERFGITPLPGWHVEEIRQEKQSDIIRAKSVEQQNPQP